MYVSHIHVWLCFKLNIIRLLVRVKGSKSKSKFNGFKYFYALITIQLNTSNLFTQFNFKQFSKASVICLRSVQMLKNTV